MLRRHDQRADELEELLGSQPNQSHAATFLAGGFTVVDPAVEDPRASELLRLVHTGALSGAYVPTLTPGYVGDTPVEGRGREHADSRSTTARWHCAPPCNPVTSSANGRCGERCARFSSTSIK